MTSAAAQRSPQASVRASEAALAAVARSLPVGGRLTVEALSLEGDDSPRTVALERFRVFAADAQIVLDDGSTVEAPATAYLRGFIDRDPSSPIVLGARQTGEVHGLALAAGSLWVLSGDGLSGLRSRRVDLETDLGGKARTFACGTSALTRVPQLTPAGSAVGAGATSVSTSTTPSYTARVAVETDYEFFAMFGNTQNTLSYLGDLFAYASTIFENEVATSLLVDYVSLWTEGSGSDPWSATSDSTAALVEYRDYWRAHRGSVDRSISHMLSGKDLGGGSAYVGTLCNDFYGYGISESLEGDFDIQSPQSIWDIIVVTHEMGHSFNSPHTHDYCGIADNPDPIDSCIPESIGTACDGASGQLPSGCSGPGENCGTIMSYCHQLAGGYSNISLTFGLGHPYGEAPDRVPGRMYTHVLNRNYCLSPVASGPTLTVDVNGTGAGSVTSDPSGLDCSVQCSSSFEAGTTVVLTATPAIGSEFDSWSGDADCADGSVTMDADTSCSATFVSTCGDGVLDSNEECDGFDLGGASCAGDCLGAPTCSSTCTIDYSTCSDGFCDTSGGESCAGCAADCVVENAAVCGNGVCEIDEGEDCLTCATDCDGRQNGKPNSRFCCGAGGENPVGCSDSRCSDGGGESCQAGPTSMCCGDGTCSSGESAATCGAGECSGGGSGFCGDGACDADEDASSCSTDCGGGGACVNPGGDPVGASCSADDDCCSNKCRGSRNRKSCKA